MESGSSGNLRPDFWLGGKLIEVGDEGVNFGVVRSATTSNIQLSIDKEEGTVDWSEKTNRL